MIARLNIFLRCTNFIPSSCVPNASSALGANNFDLHHPQTPDKQCDQVGPALKGLGGERSSLQEMKAPICPSGKLLCLWTYKIIETVYKRQKPNLFDNWADTSLHLLLLKSSMVSVWQVLKPEISNTKLSRTNPNLIIIKNIFLAYPKS